MKINTVLLQLCYCYLIGSLGGIVQQTFSLIDGHEKIRLLNTSTQVNDWPFCKIHRIIYYIILVYCTINDNLFIALPILSLRKRVSFRPSMCCTMPIPPRFANCRLPLFYKMLSPPLRVIPILVTVEHPLMPRLISQRQWP